MSYLARSKPYTIFSVIKQCGTSSTGCTYLYSQHHRMAEAGSDLWRSPWPTPAQVGPPTTSFPGPHQLAFKYLQGKRLHTLSRQPGSVSGHSHRKYMVIFFILFLNRTPCISFCAQRFSTCHQSLLSRVRKKNLKYILRE